jgi:hypothetical protein
VRAGALALPTIKTIVLFKTDNFKADNKVWKNPQFLHDLGNIHHQIHGDPVQTNHFYESIERQKENIFNGKTSWAFLNVSDTFKGKFEESDYANHFQKDETTRALDLAIVVDDIPYDEGGRPKDFKIIKEQIVRACTIAFLANSFMSTDKKDGDVTYLTACCNQDVENPVTAKSFVTNIANVLFSNSRRIPAFNAPSDTDNLYKDNINTLARMLKKTLPYPPLVQEKPESDSEEEKEKEDNPPPKNNVWQWILDHSRPIGLTLFAGAATLLYKFRHKISSLFNFRQK